MFEGVDGLEVLWDGVGGFSNGVDLELFCVESEFECVVFECFENSEFWWEDLECLCDEGIGDDFELIWEDGESTFLIDVELFTDEELFTDDGDDFAKVFCGDKRWEAAIAS